LRLARRRIGGIEFPSLMETVVPPPCSVATRIPGEPRVTLLRERWSVGAFAIAGLITPRGTART